MCICMCASICVYVHMYVCTCVYVCIITQPHLSQLVQNNLWEYIICSFLFTFAVCCVRDLYYEVT